jgi:hypothetical protein
VLASERRCPAADAPLWSLCIFFIMDGAMAELAHNGRMVSRRRGTAEEALTGILAAKMSDQPPASRSCYYCVR